MKKILILSVVVVVWNAAMAQETNFTIKGGYVMTNLQEYEESTRGWRIDGVLEFVPYTINLSHGVSFGYMHTKGTADEGSIDETKFKAWHLPLYYVPKYTFGDKAVRPFIKGAIGTHISGYKREGPLGAQIKTSDLGFYGGLGAGLSIDISQEIYLNLEYEWAYLSNSWYSNGFINSIGMGLAFRF